MDSLSVGLLAHVDAGKTTLSEAMLYCSGALRSLGRVDHGNAFLDNLPLERQRGITIFSKQARFSLPDWDVTLVDTPGHVDFAPEAERVLPILDCAVLVISGTDGVQAHTLTLWKLLERYGVPTALFVNKMDLPGIGKDALLKQLQGTLSPGCVDFTDTPERIAENAALCDEALLETYLASGTVTDGNLAGLMGERKLFPCIFGSARQLTGVEALLDLLNRLAPRKTWPKEFGARIYKISRDASGARLTWLKVTGGALRVRSPILYTDASGTAHEEKPTQLRLYSGERFTSAETVSAGMLCAAVGLSATCAGQTLGAEKPGKPPALEPVLSCRVVTEEDPATVLPKLRQLAEEEPLLGLQWDPRLRQIHVQMMGRVQTEILCRLAQERFGLNLRLEDPRILYRETIAAPVEGVGHYEPLRHYAEVHLLLTPLERGAGLVFDSACSTDVLDSNFQNLVLTHLAEKTHLGVLTGSPIADLRITLLLGRAHEKHTEGGDFRQATYRAVRQGLMEAQSILLEPWYRFTLTLPTSQVGRAITDIRTMGGAFDPPESNGELSTLTGTVPASELGDYASQVAAYTQGRGRLQVGLSGYAPCHNAQAVIDEAAYDPEADLDNPPGSVFCAHGAGFQVKWNQVKAYMHLDSGLRQEKPPQVLTRNLTIDDKELEAILEREFGPVKQTLYRPVEHSPIEETLTIRPPRPQTLLVDGYNILFQWEELAKIAETDLEAARRRLLDLLSSYAGFKKCRVIVVFDGYKVKGNPGERTAYHNLQVVYTRENETADRYLETLAAEIGANDTVRVATSDALVQLSSFRSGVLRISARELQNEVEAARQEMRKFYRGNP